MVIKYISGYHHDCDDDQEEDGGDKCREVGHPIGRAFHLVSNNCICICICILFVNINYDCQLVIHN